MKTLIYFMSYTAALQKGIKEKLFCGGETEKVMYIFVLPLIIVALLFVPFIPLIKGARNGRRVKRSFLINLCTFFGVCGLGVILPFSGLAETDLAAQAAASSSAGLICLAAALVTGLATIGAGIAVAAAAPAAIGACSEDPKSFGKSLILLALGEGIPIYGILVSFMILNKLPA